jgi:hypothetical protein
MKRFIMMIGALCLACGVLYAQESKSRFFSGSFSVSSGLFWGSVENSLSDDRGDTPSDQKTAYTRSLEENWVPYVQAGGQLNFFDFFLKGAVISAIPVRAGKAEDANFPDSGEIALRSRSENDSVLKEHFQGNAGLGYAFHFGKWQIIPQAGFTYKTRSWDAADGKALFQGRAEYYSVNGVYSSTTEVTMYPSIGLEGAFTINDLFEIRAGGNFFPYVLSETTLKNYFPNIENNYAKFTGLGGSAELGFLFTPRKLQYLSLMAGFGYEGIYLKDGDVSAQVEGFNVPEKTEIDYFSAAYDSTTFKFTLGAIVKF